MTRPVPRTNSLHDLPYADATRLILSGKHPDHVETVNPPVHRASTILHASCKELYDPDCAYVYGRQGTPTHRCVEEAICTLEQGYGTRLTPSGMSAISSVFLAFLRAGDHVLIVDRVYSCVRDLCNGVLARLGIEVTYYPASMGADIAALVTPRTKMIWMETPCSNTMEVQDVQALVGVAQEKGILTVSDNTWGAGFFHKPLTLGCDISVQAATKYLVGHADAMVGAVTTNARVWEDYATAHRELGMSVGPDDAYLCLRGIRTLGVRLKQHEHNALTVARWLQTRPEIAEVRHPALETHPGHALWKRDFTGSCGLFSIVLKPAPRAAVEACVDALTLFGLGYSWGGYESLALPFTVPETETSAEQPGIRLHIGLEDPQDLIANLAKGLEVLTAFPSP